MFRLALRPASSQHLQYIVKQQHKTRLISYVEDYVLYVEKARQREQYTKFVCMCNTPVGHFTLVAMDLV